MDRPPLHSLVRELAESERLGAFADALPARARVSESALPLVAAALYERLGRGLVLLAPDDEDARDVAEACGWLVGADRVGLLPGRGVRWESGLAPPPHLVGERARALDVLAAGGLVCASAAALAEGLPPAPDRPEPISLAVGADLGLDGLAEQLAFAAYERVERVDDEIESIRAFSPFTQRALHAVDAAVVYPAAERRLDATEPSLSDASEGLSLGHVRDDLVPALDRPPDL